MTDASLWLIVRQRPVPHPELEDLLGELRSSFGLDSYLTRQGLLGSGLAQLVQGERQQLDGIAAVLQRHGYLCWLIAPPRPTFAPPRLRGLSVSDEAIEFFCEGERRVRLARGTQVVGVLADLSGELAGRQVKRMLARNAYLGRAQATGFTPAELRQEILKGQPVFDCYLLDAQGAVTPAFRALPGRFNPEGLGARASLGAVRNLEAVVTLVGEYADNFRLHSDFGLSQLPGCLPQPAGDAAAGLVGNLDALTRYGWLVASLVEPPAADSEEGQVIPGMLAVGVAGMAAAAGMRAAAEELGAMAEPIDEAVADRAAAARTTLKSAPLPPPPDRPEPHFSLRRALPVVATFLGGMLLAVAGSTELLRPLFRQAVQTGLLPGIVAVALCWGAFACLRLKRFIEDTPTSRIRSLAMGPVEVHGRALRRYALVAPMTQSACVWYRLRKYRRDHKNRWKLVSQSDSAHVPFVLADGSGKVVVDPGGATVKVKTEQTGFPGESALIGAAVEGGPDEKWVEELIFERTSLYVLGYARPERGVRPGLHERTVEMLRRLKLDPQVLHRYDANHDGRVDAEEWQTARQEAERLAAAAQLDEKSQSASVQALIGKPPRGLPFLIAEGQTGTELAGRYGWIAVGLLISGVAGFGLALKLFLDFFRLL